MTLIYMMSAGCIKWMLCHTLKAMWGGGPGCRTPAASRFLACAGRYNITAAAAPWSWSPFCTSADDTDPAPERKKKKRGTPTNAVISSVGRKIPHVQIQVISELGENMGSMHRTEVIRIMEDTGLKLVVLNERQDPPVYRLLSGKQIYEEQIKQREKQKSKAAPVQIKELTVFPNIEGHDLKAKLKRVASWVEKKHHVKITLQTRSSDSKNNLDTNLEQMVQQIEIMVGFVKKPQVLPNGKAASCIIRPPTAKELLAKNKEEAPPSPPSQSSPSSACSPPAGSTDTTEQAAQK